MGKKDSIHYSKVTIKKWVLKMVYPGTSVFEWRACMKFYQPLVALVSGDGGGCGGSCDSGNETASSIFSMNDSSGKRRMAAFCFSASNFSFSFPSIQE